MLHVSGWSPSRSQCENPQGRDFLAPFDCENGAWSYLVSHLRRHCEDGSRHLVDCCNEFHFSISHDTGPPRPPSSTALYSPAASLLTAQMAAKPKRVVVLGGGYVGALVAHNAKLTKVRSVARVSSETAGGRAGGGQAAVPAPEGALVPHTPGAPGALLTPPPSYVTSHWWTLKTTSRCVLTSRTSHHCEGPRFHAPRGTATCCPRAPATDLRGGGSQQEQRRAWTAPIPSASSRVARVN